MNRVNYQSLWSILATAIVVVVAGAVAVCAQESEAVRPGASRAQSDRQDSLDNAATDYVQRRKREATALQETQQRERARQQATDAESSRRGNAAVSDSPKTMFAITIWIARLSEGDKNAESTKPTLPASDEFPAQFNAIGQVRNYLNNFANAGRVRSLRELQVLAVDGQSAHVQIGADKPQVTGVSTSQMGRSNSLRYTSVGTTVQVQPHLDSEKRIQIQFECSMSELQPTSDAPVFESPDGKSKVFPQTTATQQLNTTVRLRNGTAAVVKRDVTSDAASKNGQRQIDLVIVGCDTVRAQE